MKNNSLKILLLMFWAAGSAFAQTNTGAPKDTTAPRIRSHGALSRATGNKIILRWAPTDHTYWDIGNTYGYKVEKLALKADPYNPASKFTKEDLTWKNLTPQPLKPWTLDQYKAAAKDTSNKYIGVAMEMLYGEVYGNKDVTKGDNMLNALNEQQNKHAYAMMSADLDAPTASSLGLRYEDTDVKDGMFYLYRITMIHQDPDFPTDTSEIFIDFSKKYKAQPVTNMWQEAGDREILIAWTRTNQNNFSAYDIERSEDGKNWKKMNKRPYVSSFAKNEKSFIYVDSMVVNSKSYSYRLKGYTAFGDQGLYSEVISSTPKDLTAPAPAYGVKASDHGGAVKILWKAQPNEPDFDGFYVGRSALASGGFTKISKKLDKKERGFIDFQANPLENNYYVVYSVDKSGNESVSYSDLGYIVDSLAPAPPKGVKGAIDTSGRVKISWDRGPEADIIGYRVYWANDTLAEFSQLTGEVFAGTIYGDSVNIRTLSENAYYKIVAVDHRYNHSEYSKILTLKKPDIVPPAAPVITNYDQGQKEVKFSWINSTSTDVVSHKLERKYKDENWKEMASFTKKEKEWTDTKLETGQPYSYRITAIDDAGNQTSSKILMITAIDRGLRENVESLQIVNKDGRSHLEWKYQQTGNFVFVLYTNKNGGAGFEPIARLKNTEKSYNISDPNAKYGIKAVYNDGGESKMVTTK